jgi:hypothetical protein
MYDALQKEIATYEKRTPKSVEAHKQALQRIPLGVASNYRHYDPYLIFVKDGKGSRIHDVDGNDYIFVIRRFSSGRRSLRYFQTRTEPILGRRSQCRINERRYWKRRDVPHWSSN